MNTSRGYFAYPLIMWTVIILCAGCTSPSDSAVTEPSAPSISTPAPPTTPIPEVTAMDLYVECEGADSPDQKLRRTFMGSPLPECYLEGERLRVAGHLYKVNTEDEEGDVKLTVEYWLNSESRIVLYHFALITPQSRSPIAVDCRFRGNDGWGSGTQRWIMARS